MNFEDKLLSLTKAGNVEAVKKELLESYERGDKGTVDLVVDHASGSTMLHIAATQGNKELVKLLINNGAKFLSNNIGQTPLHCATISDELSCAALIMEAMKKSDPKLISSSNNVGSSALLTAAATGSLACLKLLIESGVPIDTTDTSGNTALFRTCYEGNKRCAAELLSHGSNVNARNSEGDTPLLKACERGHEEFVAFLLSSGADSISNHRALHIAAKRGHLGCCRLLVQKGADANATNSEHETCLHFAALGAKAAETGEPSRHELFNFLIDSGADPSVKSVHGKTASNLAPGKYKDLFIADNISKRHEEEKRIREEVEARKRTEEERKRKEEEERQRIEAEKARIAAEEEAKRKAEEEERKRIAEEERLHRIEEEKRLAEEEKAKKAKKKGKGRKK